MKIAVVANCQGESIRRCLEAINPNIEASSFMVHHVVNDIGWIERMIEENDLIIAHRLLRNAKIDLPTDKVVFAPNVAFNGYHPDLTFVRGLNHDGELESVVNMFGGYHSGIVLHAYKTSMDQEACASLFSPETYDRLGYTDMYNKAYGELIEEGILCGIPLDALILRWSRMAPFMYSSNHPKFHVIEDIVRKILKKLGIDCVFNNVHEYIDDPLREMPIWPIYPGIAERFGLIGDLSYRANRNYSIVPLRSFIAESYCHFDRFKQASLEAINLPIDDYSTMLRAQGGSHQVPTSENPYSKVPSYQFWKNSVADVARENFDPVVGVKFSIGQNDKVATAGSCFAQHIARTLSASGFNYLVSELAPLGVDRGEAAARNYGVFTARYGNIYTVRQLKQLLDRVFGQFNPVDIAWEGKVGGFIDPFRPQIEPNGFISKEALLSERDLHFEAVRTMLREMDCFIFTLGLTEGWQSKIDGAVFPVAPGVVSRSIDPSRYEFRNFSVQEMELDFAEVIGILKQINPNLKIILTVSPVPLIATYENRNALVATTYSKAALRVVAENLATAYEFVDYFSSFEIITGSYNRGAYFGPDLREVTQEGVAHVMSIFMKHYANSGAVMECAFSDRLMSKTRNAFFDVVCDEEAIAKF